MGAFEIVRDRFDEFIRTAETDGCSGVPDFNLKACCAEHDFYYNYDVDVTRWEADAMFYQCIRDHHRPFIAAVYWAGVRLFGRHTYDQGIPHTAYNPQALKGGRQWL